MPLPHFTNVESHQSKWEPIYKNLFEVDITPPTKVAQIHTNATHFCLENTVSINMPKYPDIPQVMQRFKYSTRVFTMMPENTSFNDLSITFNLNQNDQGQMVCFRIMKDWYDMIWNNEDGSITYKANHVGTIVIYHHDKEGKVIRRVTCNNCMLHDFSGLEELSWNESTTVMELTCKFYCDYWEDYYF